MPEWQNGMGIPTLVDESILKTFDPRYAFPRRISFIACMNAKGELLCIDVTLIELP